MKSLEQVQEIVGDNFAVMRERTPEFRSYIDYLNMAGANFSGSESVYYGYLKGKLCSAVHNYLPEDTNILTAKEIMAIINERTIEDIEREVAALLKEKAQLEAAQPLGLFTRAINHIPVEIGSCDMPWAVKLGENNDSIIINNLDFEVKPEMNSENHLEITFHKKVKQCN